jgi:geranylgeranyl diphosphate synthase type II
MIHTFSLIHDDLPALDNDDLRRGAPTSHKQFGEAMAILAGDALHTLAFATITKYQRADNPATVLHCVAILADAAGTAGMVGGQVDDIYYEGRQVTPEVLGNIHARKTGALLNASILTGALLCGAVPDQEAALRTYGDRVGLAFQIIDDILDVTGDDAKLGKPTGSDTRNDKATYPKLFGLDTSALLAREAAAGAVAALTGFGPSADPLRAFARFIVDRDV